MTQDLEAAMHRVKLWELKNETIDQHICAYNDPVAVKVRPVKADLPEEFHAPRHIYGDPLADLPDLPTHPPVRTVPPTESELRSETQRIVEPQHHNTIDSGGVAIGGSIPRTKPECRHRRRSERRRVPRSRRRRRRRQFGSLAGS
ncbi:hypothetical protein F5878DRAFT_668296 [Lentinula raphanica]|uniref:Uncharacterized protein n=1 Tax=Lentinula raphanica TaxID=153919 RepID=A0AA38NUF2_9AGAR|nr:hypothetical protein F5878DRAFT_668296 [Lentinula raphanica]